ncbi:hypothetical protein AJ80_07368 [Polytolypa hystricis UAMH7299]|uniref:Uncharacterized protein n=1 Tax=Polytolypa hystricis (strain UAMH7299) TaxID=1447883 RepID=A0A2B7XQN7_POLH7|nr:hypothetical protein AJ80_07368 [Polytolypa hystricis UAMH7299]
MGNSQSSLNQRRRRRSNRLSKPPTNYSSNLLKLTAARRSERFTDSTPLSSYNPWLEAGTVEPVENKIYTNRHSSPRTSYSHSSYHSHEADSSEDNKMMTGLGNIVDGLKRRLSLTARPSSQQRRSSFSQEQDSPVGDGLREASQSHENEPEVSDIPFGMEFVAASSVDGPALQNRRFSSIRRLSLLNNRGRTSVGLLQTIFSPRNTQNNNDEENLHFHSNTPVMYRRSSLDSFFQYEYGRSASIRASTPSDLEYSHLGRLKLGSLRVVNGAASPVPSDHPSRSTYRQSLPDIARYQEHNDSDYFGYGAWNAGPHGKHEFISSHNPSSTNLMAPQIVRSKSALTVTRSSRRRAGSGIELSTDRRSWPNQISQVESQPVQNVEHDNPATQATQPSQVADQLSILVTDRPLALVTTSKANEFDDDLFEDEGIGISCATTESGPRPSTRSSIRIVKDRKSYPLNKADSGYSSSSSYRSFRKNRTSVRGKGSMDRAVEDGIAIPSSHDNTWTSGGGPQAIDECNEPSTSRPNPQRIGRLTKSPPSSQELHAKPPQPKQHPRTANIESTRVGRTEKHQLPRSSSAPEVTHAKPLASQHPLHIPPIPSHISGWSQSMFELLPLDTSPSIRLSLDAQRASCFNQDIRQGEVNHVHTDAPGPSFLTADLATTSTSTTTKRTFSSRFLRQRRSMGTIRKRFSHKHTQSEPHTSRLSLSSWTRQRNEASVDEIEHVDPRDRMEVLLSTQEGNTLRQPDALLYEEPGKSRAHRGVWEGSQLHVSARMNNPLGAGPLQPMVSEEKRKIPAKPRKLTKRPSSAR